MTRRAGPGTGAGSTPPRHGLDDLAQFRARLAQLRAEISPPTSVAAYEAYTDGACLRNPYGPGGWGVWIGRHGLSVDLAELWGHLTSTSNNRAEALALLASLEWVPAGSTLILHSDSEYTVRVLSGAYRAKANLDVWQEIRQVIREKNLTVHPEWVRGHAGDPGNERADWLAVLGAVNGDTERAATLRSAAAAGGRAPRATRPRPASLPRGVETPQAGPALPPELRGLAPRGDWETSFLSSVSKQLRAGRPLSEKQQAVLERIRARSRGTGDAGTANDGV